MMCKGVVYTAISGGVDSAVAAALLLEDGYQVFGIHMETWKAPNTMERGSEYFEDKLFAENVANALGIPLTSLDLRNEFYESIIKSFIQQYSNGRTPNPCLFCNPQIKWGILQNFALDQGSDFFATGHYARLERNGSCPVRLLKGRDKSKDQSYVLCLLSQTQLQKSLLPLGEMTKEEVRGKALEMDLPVANREDSQDLCFLGDLDYRDFLKRYYPLSQDPGEIVTIDGEVVGEHDGLAFFTIGQRKGIRVAADEPYYVVDKDIGKNRLIIGFDEQAGKNYLIASDVNWISGEPPQTGEMYAVMVRYRTSPVLAVLSSVTENYFKLEFKRHLRGITPGQVAAIYQGDACLGGGVIHATDNRKVSGD